MEQNEKTVCVRQHLRRIPGRKRKKLIKSYHRAPKGAYTAESNDGGDPG